MEKSNLQNIIFAALMAAITAIATMVIRIPSFGGTGYVNVGDAAVLLCSWLIGGIYGALASGIGSAMADLLGGYAYYVPGTFAIKFTMALVAWIIYKRLDGHSKNKVYVYIISALPAEVIMVVGYFLYKAFILGKGYAAAVPNVFTNCIQGAVCLVSAVLTVLALKQVRGLGHV